MKLAIALYYIIISIIRIRRIRPGILYAYGPSIESYLKCLENVITINNWRNKEAIIYLQGFFFLSANSFMLLYANI